MNRLILIGAGGHGKVVAETAESCGYRDVAFVDDNWPSQQSNGRWPVVEKPGPIEVEEHIFCSIGSNSTRAFIFANFPLEHSPVLIHQTAVISKTSDFGVGTLVVAGVIVNADSLTGCGVILNTGCSVDHDCILGDFVHISPGARLAGDVTIGDRSWIGIGAVVREGVSIGTDVIVGAGAAVVNDIPNGQTVVGVPATPV